MTIWRHNISLRPSSSDGVWPPSEISDEKASQIGIKAFAYKSMVTADLAKTVRKVLDEAKSRFMFI
jgi:hypothetical protein